MTNPAEKSTQSTTLAKSLSIVNKILTTRKNLLCLSLGSSPTKTVHAKSPHFPNLQDGSHQIRVRKTCSLWKNSEMANDLNRIRHSIHFTKSNQRKCGS